GIMNHTPTGLWPETAPPRAIPINGTARRVTGLAIAPRDELLAVRRKAGADAPDDITTHLLRNTSLGRPLTQDEIVSILRNWTVGELGTFAASIGIIVHYLASNPDIQQQLRDQPDLMPAANDEILRMHAPLIMNRRVTTREVELGGRTLPAGTRIAVIWA